MKNIFTTIGIDILLAVLAIYVKNDSTETKSYIYLLPLVFLVTPILRSMFPFLKKLEIGTLNFFPNLFNFF